MWLIFSDLPVRFDRGWIANTLEFCHQFSKYYVDYYSVISFADCRSAYAAD